MIDVHIAWNTTIGAYDLQLVYGELARDDGLETLALVSLLTDRLADPDDVLPDGQPAGTGNRRGCWLDEPLSNAPSYLTPNLMGSRLWLLRRAKQITETLRQAEAYASEALAWMVEDGLVGSVTPVATFPSLGRMNLAVAIVRDGASTTFNVAWAMTTGTWQLVAPN